MSKKLINNNPYPFNVDLCVDLDIGKIEKISLQKPVEDWEKEFRKMLSEYQISITDKFPNSEPEEVVKQFISTQIAKARKEGADGEREKVKSRIGMLRQYLNERTKSGLITSEELEEFLIN